MTSSIDDKRFLSPRELQQSAGSSLLLDVRSPAEFRERHIEYSVLEPINSLEPEQVKKLAQGRKSCVVICGSGRRAAMAADKLRKAGMAGVSVLEGGIQAWEGAGLPLVRGKATISLERQVRIAAGTLVTIGTLLAFVVSPVWLILPGFVGCGLIFAGVTDTCGMGILLAHLPWNK